MNASTASCRRRRPRGRGFTLVELLVTVSILIVLAAVLTVMLRSVKSSAQRATCLSRLREVCGMLLGEAVENNGRVQAFQGGSGGFDYRPYFIIRDQLGLPKDPYDAHYSAMRDLMFCPSAPDPTTPHWNSYGVNFTKSEIAGAEWVQEKIQDSSGNNATVSSLGISAVTSPQRYVLMADSSQSSGQQVFRIVGSDRIGLRHGGKANACFLDGSAKSLSIPELGALGFQNAYDNRTDPPTSVSLPKKP
ncbi:MAG: prepilin-type N-terminal cleavage/methylation domain-containing protein [Akkermansiaceae bacterium]|nr:prepilin-type N-terminal cleavage/methylation domain-containing protein [Akkermansiaceae bacterium]